MMQTKLNVANLEKKLLKTWAKTVAITALILGGGFITARPAFAEISICASEDAFCSNEKIPFKNAPMPNYVAKIIPSNENLPTELYDLSARAVRVLPKEIKNLQHKVKRANIPKHGYIVIETNDSKPFCDKQREFCWFKKMTLSGHHVHISDWDNNTVIYADTSGLNKLFWDESIGLNQ